MVTYAPSAITKPPAGAQVDWAHPLAHGLAAFWPFNEGSGLLAADLVSGQNLAFVNGPKWTRAPGRATPAISFTRASAQYLTPAGDPPAQLPLAVTAYSLSAWVTLLSYIDSCGIIGWGNFGTGEQVNALKITTFPDNGIDNYWWSDDYHIAAGMLTDGLLHQIVATCDGSAKHRRMYVDGAPVGTNTATGTHAAPLTNFSVGRAGALEYWTGIIEHASVYARALSDAEVAQLYAEPFAMLRRPDGDRYLSLASPATTFRHSGRQFANRAGSRSGF